MTLRLEASLDDAPISATAAVLAEWYASHSVVRRLWAIEAVDAIRIVVMLEPTVDGDDTQPAWLAHNWTWAHDLQLRTHRTVRLEMINDASHIDSLFDTDSALITEMSWRDPSTAADW